jgi:hypothetical protein
MPKLDDAAVEHRLRGVLKEHLDALPLDLTVDALDRRREARGAARRPGRGRGMTLLAAAALLIVGGALAAGSGLLRLPTVVPPVPEPSVAVVATASPDATSPSPSEPAAPSAAPIPVAGPGGVWIPVGSMMTSRFSHTGVRLQDGRVLVVGGYSGEVGYQHDLTSVELYDPATGTWSATGSISKPLVAVTSLRDGKVLALVGHFDSPRTAEVYDPASGSWTATGPMDPSPMESDTFTMLQDGRVLLAGDDGAQVYDPDSGTWTATGPMVAGASGDKATVLRDGRVLDWGAAQVYDPASGTWTATGKKGDASGAAALLSDGKVLVAGGREYAGDLSYYFLDSAQVYDPATGSWTAIANMHEETWPAAAFLQPDGKVLVLGSSYGDAFHAEEYDPASGTWTEISVRPTVLATSDLADDSGEPACGAMDLYDPDTGAWTTAWTTLACGPRSLTPLLDGTFLVAGGTDCIDDSECGSTATAALYVPAGVALPPLPAFASPPPFVMPSATPVPAPLPPADGPVPPNALSWTVTVDNESSEPATLFVAVDSEGGLRLVGSATPNVVPAGTSMEVTFLFPANGDGWITVNPRLGEGLGGLVNADQIGIPGKIWIPAEGEGGWLSP